MSYSFLAGGNLVKITFSVRIEVENLGGGGGVLISQGITAGMGEVSGITRRPGPEGYCQMGQSTPKQFLGLKGSLFIAFGVL